MNLRLTFTLATGAILVQPTSDFRSVKAATDQLGDLVRTPSAINLSRADGGVHVVNSQHVVSVLVEEQAP